jgi:hypothetical protein
VHLAVLSPLRRLSEAIEFRRLRRCLPNVHRAWSTASGKLRPETNADYLARLRALPREQEQLRNAKAAAKAATAAPQQAAEGVCPSGSRPNADDLSAAIEAAE